MRKLDALPTWALLGGLVTVSTVLRAIAGLDVPTPLIGPDEQIYAQLGQSIYEEGRFELWGEPNRFYTLTYPLYVGLSLAYGDIEIGYAMLKVFQALVMSLTAVPVYLWGRRLTTRGWALVAAALTLVVPGLAYSGLVMTEVLFYPVATLAAWASAAALERPTARRQLVAAALILVATATRLQAVVFLPALASAIVLKALLDRRPRDVLRFWPGAAALGAAALAWAFYRLRGGGPASELLGAYRAAGDVTYDWWDAARFTAWHLADAVLFTCVVPSLALVLLLAGWRRHDEALRAFAAVAAALMAWLAIEVGVFASRNVGHLAERDLLALVPLLFLALAAWLGQGAARPRAAAGLAAVGIAATVLYLPVARFITHAELPDAFTIIPLLHLRERYSWLDVELGVGLLTALFLAAALLLPRRYLVALPAAIAVLLGAASISVSGTIAAEAAFLRDATTGRERTWVDFVAQGPVTFIYTGDLYALAPWSLRFWNDRITRVVRLHPNPLPGPVPQPLATLAPDGALLGEAGRVEADYVLTSTSVQPFGGVVARGGPMTLWSVEPPLRISLVLTGLRYDGTFDPSVDVTAYACAGGALEFTLVAAGAQRVSAVQNGTVVASRQLADGEGWTGAIEARPAGGICSVGLQAEGKVQTQRFVFERF